MPEHHPRTTLACSLIAMIALGGCIERAERITIRPDGGAMVKVTHTSDSWDEMYMGDAWPRLEGGWLADNRTEREDDGSETFILEAEATIPPGVPFPSTYEIDTDPFPGTATRFPTTLVIEERRDGTYYHFRRTYAARDWAYIGKIREQIEERIKDDEEAGGEDRERTPAEERARQLEIIKALTDFETVKFEHFTKRALEDVVPDAPQDVFLAARRALREQAASIDFERIAELLKEEDDQRREEALDAEAQAFEKDSMEALEMGLRETGWIGGSQVREFFERFAWHREYFRITEELADDVFKITVVMPGRIAAHNADNAGGREVSWELTGDMFRDRDVELMVTSRLP